MFPKFKENYNNLIEIGVKFPPSLYFKKSMTQSVNFAMNYSNESYFYGKFVFFVWF